MKLPLHRYFALTIVVLLIGVFVQRIYIIDMFAARYADHDQALMWLGATEFKHLRFHEPFFYGQNYNFMLEALVAVPFLVVGIPHHYALPVATSLIFLFPFIFMAIISFKRNWYISALFSILIILVMPLRFHMITTLPRGFITGPSLAAIATIIAISNTTRWRYFWFSLVGILAAATLPSALLIIIPVGLYLLLTYKNDANFYRLGALGGAVGAAVYGAMLLFYQIKPEYNFSRLNNNDVSFSFNNLISNLHQFSRYFGDVLPTFSDANGFLPLLLFLVLILIILLLKKSYKHIFVFWVILFILFISLGTGKIVDGSDSVFYPFSRYYLATVFLIIFLVWLVDGYIVEFIDRHRFVAATFLVLCVLYTSFSLYRFAANISTDIMHELEIYQPAVIVYSTDFIRCECERLNNISNKFAVELIVGDDAVLNYAYPALYSDKPPTLLMRIGYREREERRTWRILDEADKVRHMIMIYDGDNAIIPHKRANIIYEEHKKSSIYILRNPHSLTSKNLLYNYGYSLTTYRQTGS
jgi:hypothetical protein